MTNSNFSYGNKTAFNDYVAKDVIAPNNIELEQDDKTHKLYIYTHNNYGCGE